MLLIKIGENMGMKESVRADDKLNQTRRIPKQMVVDAPKNGILGPTQPKCHDDQAEDVRGPESYGLGGSEMVFVQQPSFDELTHGVHERKYLPCEGCHGSALKGEDGLQNYGGWRPHNSLNTTNGILAPIPVLEKIYEFSDSEYGSIPNWQDDISSADDTLARKSEHTSERPRREAEMAYSGAATVIAGYTQELVAYLCDDIYLNIEDALHSRTSEFTTGALSRIIKALALKLGSVTTKAMNQRLMFFVYKNHE